MFTSFSKELEKNFVNWLNWLVNNKNLSSNTVDAYKRDVLNFINFIAEYQALENVTLSILADLQNRDFKSWVAKKRMNQISINSTSRHLSSIKNFFNFLKQKANIENKYILAMSISKKDNFSTHNLNLHDIQKLIDSIDSSNKKNWIILRDKVIFMLMYGCGLRISEVLGVKIGDFIGDFLNIKGKGDKERSIPVHEKVKEYVLKYIDVCPYVNKKFYTNLLFVTQSGKILRRSNFGLHIIQLRRRAGLSEDVTAHSFRRAFATHLMKEGVDIRHIQEMLGHKSISTTERYTKIQNSDLMNAIQHNHPRNRKENNKDEFKNKI